MRDDQKRFLERVAYWIPVLFTEITKGNASSEVTLGVRMVGDRRARLFIRVEVIDPGTNPMQTHGLHDTHSRGEVVEVDVKPPSRRSARHRRGQKTWTG